MITYTYVVKCPNCDEEFFDFFDEAKAFALGCLSQKPIITQTEVNRNDFGECTDSSDLGTVWSWEDLMKETETEPAINVFTKDDFTEYSPDHDEEFDALDNSLDFEPEISEVSAIDEVPDNFRKPIPDGMTIEELVEEMEENEDTVECAWCEELFDKSECRYEVNLGWLCSRCEAAIKSRGETLTFRENNYWDFLDEGIVPDELLANCVDFSDFEIWGAKKLDDVTYKAELIKRYEKVDLKDSDAGQEVYDEMYSINGLFTFSFGKDGKPTLNAWNRSLLNEFGNCEIIFDDADYDVAVENALNKKNLQEMFNPSEKVNFEYEDLEVILLGGSMDRETGTYDEHEVSSA